MSFLVRLPISIREFRLGYSPQHPYPWRWTTPIVLSTFVLLTAFLAIINIPLAAYSIVQEFTYHPNDTLPRLPFSSFIPEILQHSTDSFAPHTLTVGDMIQLNNSAFKFTVKEVLDNSRQVSSFSYYNNPFSDGCDVTNLVIFVDTGNAFETKLDLMVDVACHIPTLFTMTWSFGENEQGINFGLTASDPAWSDFGSILLDLAAVSGFWRLSAPNVTSGKDDKVTATVGVAVQPCCNCESNSKTGFDRSTDTASPSQAPCRLEPARFMAVDVSLTSSQNYDFWQGTPNTTNIFSTSPIVDFWGDNVPGTEINTLFQNAFQSIYHLVRRDLGLILENQIYASPEMYNLSILNVHLPRAPAPINPNFPAANRSRRSTSNATLMSEWRNSVCAFTEGDRVPIMPYLRPVPQLKPLGSAITSVFVSTFAMLSTLWTIFNLIAGAFARSRSDDANGKRDEYMQEKTVIVEECDPTNRSEAPLFAAEGLHWQPSRDPDYQHLSLIVERMQRSLKKHGILGNDDDASLDSRVHL
ncbi:hypothetical protein C8J57DRAFT_1318657 [Mycena rebaudengoi]|nr:hypothetical protein C8J57DRAFT_1318657 [Mycena rebaudengoi]